VVHACHSKLHGKLRWEGSQFWPRLGRRRDGRPPLKSKVLCVVVYACNLSHTAGRLQQEELRSRQTWQKWDGISMIIRSIRTGFVTPGTQNLSRKHKALSSIPSTFKKFFQLFNPTKVLQMLMFKNFNIIQSWLDIIFCLLLSFAFSFSYLAHYWLLL
jgi:hypothetical protein